MRIELTDTIQDGLEAVLLFAFKDGELPEAARAWAEANTPWLARLVGECKGNAGKPCILHAPEDAKLPRVVLAGLGKPDKFDLHALRESAASALALCRERGFKRVGLPAAALEGLGDNPAQTLGEAAYAALIGLYAYDTFKSEKSENAGLPETLEIIGAGDSASEAMAFAQASAAGVSLARDLVNAPANVATPRFIAGKAAEVAARHGFKADILGPERIRELGMGALWSVARGSAEPPRLAVVDTMPDSDNKPVVLVGKGVTFDTGGISLKPSAGMEAMKGDMAGAAAVIGTLEALGRLGADRRVIGVMPLVENMPGRDATRPGDVVRTMSGKTVEIVNTDAEGRLILCDAMHYGSLLAPAAMVDIATLTGACVVALGDSVAAYFTENDGLAEVLEGIGEERGERYWRMPLWDMYFEALKSDTADMKNVGTRMGGAIHAALFLKQFAPEGAPWAHLDIAGPGFSEKGKAMMPKGATGFGVRALLDLALQFGK